MALEQTPLQPFLHGTASKNTRSLLRIIILSTIAGAAIASRLFSVIREWASLLSLHVAHERAVSWSLSLTPHPPPPPLRIREHHPRV